MSNNLVEYDVRLRGAGKTHDLVEWWASNPTSRRIVVPDHQQARQVVADHHGISGQQAAKIAVTFDDLRAGRLLRGRGDVEIAIDNLDMILQRLIPPNALLRRVTATGCWADATILSMRADDSLWGSDAIVP